jgi:hypothetical protein
VCQELEQGPLYLFFEGLGVALSFNHLLECLPLHLNAFVYECKDTCSFLLRDGDVEDFESRYHFLECGFLPLCIIVVF